MAALALALAANAAPTPAPEPQESIVVTGTAPTPEEVRRRAVDFVRGTGIANGQTPAARWAEPVCPRVLGLGAEQAAAVDARLRAIAREAGIRVARAPCKANVAVSFAADAGAVVRTVALRSPRRLAEVPPDARAALLEGPAPIRWWYSTDTRSRHGMRGRAVPTPASGGDGDSHAEGGGSMLPSSVPQIPHYDSSIISTQAVRVLTSATVVVDVGRLDGMPLDAVASYAAFVAFAEIRAGDFTPPGSILGLFAAPSAPRELTGQDLAFLRALYRLPLDRGARHHRGTLVRELVEAHRTGG